MHKSETAKDLQGAEFIGETEIQWTKLLTTDKPGEWSQTQANL